MSLSINGIETFLARTGPFVDTVVRAATKADWVRGAVFYGLMTPGEEGDMARSPGVHVDVIGPVVIEEGDDETGRAPVLDPRYHVTLRLSGPALEAVDESGALKWQAMAVAWSALGDSAPVQNAAEEARVLHDVALINPDSLRTPLRVWAWAGFTP
ncbi:MAG: hypothetical protein IBX58_11545 [Roseovarius sp.]|nr:hypothetical protein [Roseovarius sp.]